MIHNENSSQNFDLPTLCARISSRSFKGWSSLRCIMRKYLCNSSITSPQCLLRCRPYVCFQALHSTKSAFVSCSVSSKMEPSRCDGIMFAIWSSITYSKLSTAQLIAPCTVHVQSPVGWWSYRTILNKECYQFIEMTLLPRLALRHVSQNEDTTQVAI